MPTKTVRRVILKIPLHPYIGHEKIKHSEPNGSNFSRNIITIINISISVSGCQYHNHRQGISPNCRTYKKEMGNLHLSIGLTRMTTEPVRHVKLSMEITAYTLCVELNFACQRTIGTVTEQIVDGTPDKWDVISTTYRSGSCIITDQPGQIRVN